MMMNKVRMLRAADGHTWIAVTDIFVAFRCRFLRADRALPPNVYRWLYTNLPNDALALKAVRSHQPPGERSSGRRHVLCVRLEHTNAVGAYARARASGQNFRHRRDRQALRQAILTAAIQL